LSTIQPNFKWARSKNGVGSGAAIFVQKELTHQMKYKLHDRCSNNQAEQLAIVTAVQATKTVKINHNIPRIIIMMHTDSRITWESLKNMKTRNYLIEETRKKTITLEIENWAIVFAWIKAHAGHHGNELANKLAKEAARNSNICFNKIPKSQTEHQEREKSIEKWQQQWENTAKGSATKEFSQALRTD
jgi:ribonuclease HI